MVNPPEGRPMSGGVGAPVGLFLATGVSAPERVKVSVEFNLVVHLVLKRKAVCAAVTAAVQSVWNDLLPQVNEELVESGLSGETVRKSRLAGQPGGTDGVRSSLSAGTRRAEIGRC